MYLCIYVNIYTHTHKQLLQYFVVNQTGKISKLNNNVAFISIFVLDHIVGHREKTRCGYTILDSS